jgi:hypothetical protein
MPYFYGGEYEKYSWGINICWKNRMKSDKKVYVGMSAGIIHTGHLNILHETKKLGTITVDVLVMRQWQVINAFLIETMSNVLP